MPGKDFRFGISSNVQGLDLNELLITHALSTYFMKVAVDMPELSLQEGDVLLVDRALVPKKNDLVVAAINEDPELKIVKFSDITEEFEFWGVAEHVIRKLRS
jgi:SOS-response transcriptional repressor LexA